MTRSQALHYKELLEKIERDPNDIPMLCPADVLVVEGPRPADQESTIQTLRSSAAPGPTSRSRARPRQS